MSVDDDLLENGIAVAIEIFNAIFRDSSTDTNNTSVTQNTCDTDKINTVEMGFYMLIPGVLIPLVLSFFMKRKSACLQCCHGRPGVPTPMNAIDMKHMRLAYIFAFGCVTSTMLQNFFDGPLEDFSSVFPSWSSGLLKLAEVVIYGIIWYPLFAVISAEMIVGYIIGFLFVSFIYSANLYNIIVCLPKNPEPAYVAVLVANALPQYIIMTLMLGYFIYATVLQICSRDKPSTLSHLKENATMAMYVENVFKFKKEDQGIKGKLKSCFQLNVPGFIYPPRFLCSLSIACTVLYTIIVLWLGVIIPGLSEIKANLQVLRAGDTRNSYEVIQSIINYNSSQPLSFLILLEDSVAIVVYFFDLLLIIVSTSTGITVAIIFVHFPLILLNYRRNVLLAYKGKYTHIIPPSELSTSSAIAGFSRFVGYQAAYLVWGCIVTWLVLSLIILLVTFLVIVPVINGFGQYWFALLKQEWPTLLTTTIFIIFTKVVTSLVFVDKAAAPIIAITNRSLYFIWAYFLTFYNIFIGLLSCLLRIIKSTAIGVFFIGRIDVPVMSRYFEKLDPGYVVYSEFIATEIAHNNPIMRTFLNILIEQGQRCSTCTLSREGSEKSDSPIAINCDHPDGIEPVVDSLLHRQVVFKWQLFYTLHNNPSLIILRKVHLDRYQEMMDKKLLGKRIKKQKDGTPELLSYKKTSQTEL